MGFTRKFFPKRTLATLAILALAGLSCIYSACPVFGEGSAPTLDLFVFDTIGGPQTTHAEFEVTIKAVDQNGALLESYNGVGSLSDYTGISTRVQFTNGVCKARVNIAVARNGDVITVTNGGIYGASNSFDIVAAPYLDHFEFQTIGNPQTSNAEFHVFISATDQNDRLYPEYDGLGTLSDSSGLSMTVVFSHGHCEALVTIHEAQSNDILILYSGNKTGTSNPFNVYAPHLDHFEFQTVGGPQTVGREFHVKISAVDQNGGLFRGYNGVGTLTDYTGLSATAIFSYGECEALVTINTARNQNRIAINGGGAFGTSNAFDIQPKKESISSFPFEEVAIIAALTAALAIVATLDYQKRQRKQQKKSEPDTDVQPTPATVPSVIPPSLKVTSDQVVLAADGKSATAVTVQLVDKYGNPMPASADTQVRISAEKAKLEWPVIIIPKGKDTQRTHITAPLESGPDHVTFYSEEHNTSTVLRLNFTERSMYCMHCGKPFPANDEYCHNCGLPPFSRTYTKTCVNCKAEIPAQANFCSECGYGRQS
jgi:hypothetical protein